MSKFDGSRVDDIEYDFTTPKDYRPDPDEPGISEAEKQRRLDVLEHGRWKGTVPEPAETQVVKFYAAVTDLQLEASQREDEALRALQASARDDWRTAHPDDAGLPDSELDAKIRDERTVSAIRHEVSVLAEVRASVRTDLADRLNTALAEFTQDTPGADVLGYLPFRVVDGFRGYCAGFFSPEALAAAISG